MAAEKQKKNANILRIYYGIVELFKSRTYLCVSYGILRADRRVVLPACVTRNILRETVRTRYTTERFVHGIVRISTANSTR